MAKAKTQMTTQHKEALAEGRADGRVIKNYLEALEQTRPRRGKRTPESIKKRLTTIEHEIASASPLHRLQLIQKRMDLQREREILGTTTDISSLETAFVKIAARYAERKGISYAAWRELGVQADVLGRAGIGRGI